MLLRRCLICFICCKSYGGFPTAFCLKLRREEHIHYQQFVLIQAYIWQSMPVTKSVGLFRRDNNKRLSRIHIGNDSKKVVNKKLANAIRNFKIAYFQIAKKPSVSEIDN